MEYSVRKKCSMMLLFIILATLPATLSAQVKVVRGQVVNADTREGIPYVNIGIEGTYHGTASNDEGFFELRIMASDIDKKLVFSAIGFQPESFLARDVPAQDNMLVALQEQAYRIQGEVNVAAQSLVLFRVIRTAIGQVPQRFMAGPWGAKLYYIEQTGINGAKQNSREAIVELFDRTGYSAPTVSDAFDSRNYRFIQARRNFEPWSYAAGQTGFEELLEMDHVRMSNGIMDATLLNDFTLSFAGMAPYENDSVWVIAYTLEKPDLAHTGDFFATNLSGRIYILKSSNIPLRIECSVKASRNSWQNRALYTDSEHQSQVSYRYVVTYQPVNGKYLISFVECSKTFVNPQGEKVSYARRANALEFQPEPDAVTGRDYFEDVAYVEEFWKSFQQPQ